MFLTFNKSITPSFHKSIDRCWLGSSLTNTKKYIKLYICIKVSTLMCIVHTHIIISSYKIIFYFIELYIYTKYVGIEIELINMRYS